MKTTRGLTGAEALLRVLRGMGVDTIFASPGSDWAPLWEALARPAGAGEVPRYVSVRHEETAVAMASGYAKSTGRLPAVVVHTTVGALHATMGVRAALHERVPMVILAGESIAFGEPPGPPVGRQWLRVLTDRGGPARLMEPVVKWSWSVNPGAMLPATIARACQLAMDAPKGPVFVSVPLETLLETMTADPPSAATHVQAPVADAAGLETLARMLAGATSPLIVTEELGKHPGAVRHLVALAETLGAPVVEAWHPDYINFPRTHPLYGGIAVEDMAERIKESDVALLVETVAPWHPASSLPAGGTKVAMLGESPLHPHLPVWNFSADLVLRGEAEPSLARLVEAVRAIVPEGTRAAAIERHRTRHETGRRRLRAELARTGEGATIQTAWVAHELNAVLPRDAIVVNETITHRLDLLRALDTLEPGTFYESSYGGLGMGLGTALGVAAAAPGRPVILLIGDGSFHYNPVPASFGACQELGLPMLVVLFNNAGYLSQKGDVISEYPDGHAVRTRRFAGTSIRPRPEYPLLARAYGGWGETVTAPREVRAALTRGLEAVARGQFALVDVVLDAVNPHELT